MVGFDVVVVVPRLTFAVPQLHVSHAAFDETPGDQQLPRLVAGPVRIEHVLRLARDVERVGRLELHAGRELKRMNSRLQLRHRRCALRDGDD